MSTNPHDRYIALLTASGEPEAFAAGTTIFEEGEPGERLYVVKSGSVSLAAGGRELETVGPGGLFGEMAVIDRGPRSATAVAESDGELVAIDKRRFWFLVQETPYFAEIVMRVMADRLRRETGSPAETG
jgi:CRP-like cAMP-binding protein